MRFSFLVFLLFGSQCFLFGQHSIQYTFGLSDNFRVIIVNNPKFQATEEIRNNNESPKTLPRFGIDYFYKMNKKIEIKSGFRISYTGFIRKQRTEDDITPDTELSEYLIFQKNTNIEIPLILRYYFSSKKLKPFVETGFIPRQLIKAEMIAKSEEYSTNIDNYNRKNSKFKFVAAIGAGLVYDISQIFYTNLALIGRYEFYLPKTDAYITDRHYNYGAEIGFGVRL